MEEFGKSGIFLPGEQGQGQGSCESLETVFDY